MTRERRITILILVATLAVGIFIGLLIPGFFHKYRGDMQRGRGGPGRGDLSKKEWFARTLYRVLQPDSNQMEKMKPITDWASQQIEAVETSSNERMSDILDSVKVQLKPILTEEQQKKMTEFQGRANGQWKGNGYRRR